MENEIVKDLRERTAEQVKTNHTCPVSKYSPLPSMKEQAEKAGPCVVWPKFETFSEALDYALNMRKKSYNDINKHMGRASSFIYDLRKGKYKNTRKYIAEIEKFLNTPPEFLQKPIRVSNTTAKVVSYTPKAAPVETPSAKVEASSFKMEFSGVYSMAQLNNLLSLINRDNKYKVTLAIEQV